MLKPTLPITKRLLNDTAHFNFYGDGPFAIELATEIERRNTALMQVVVMLNSGTSNSEIIDMCNAAIAGE